MGEFRMPSLGADMEWGKLVQWLVKPGDRIRRGDIVATVETQKGLFDVEIFEEGIMGEPLVQAGQKVPVGTVLAMIHSEGTSGAAGIVTKAPPAVTARIEQQPLEAASMSPVPPAQPSVSAERVACSPSARRLAAELGVNIEEVRGTGPHGAIQRSDVEQAAQERKAARQPAPSAEPAAPAPSETRAAEALQQGMRQAIAAAMSRSNREIPHYYLEMEIDMSRPLRWLEGENLKRPIRERILPAALLLKAVANALRDVPELNGYWLDDRLQIKPELHIGFAVSLRQGGLITPAIHNVDKLSLNELMQAMGDLIERTRAGRLRSSEVTDTTITVTNLGDLGVKTVYGVIYPPQVALVAFGRIMERPWAESGMLGVRRCVSATLAADHRATDGRRGSQFLEALNRHLQSPEKL
jgi:pyruvate dehydrogenase E2 component (dihydrolipoamide acetyltransferase)